MNHDRGDSTKHCYTQLQFTTPGLSNGLGQTEDKQIKIQTRKEGGWAFALISGWERKDTYLSAFLILHVFCLFVCFNTQRTVQTFVLIMNKII